MEVYNWWMDVQKRMIVLTRLHSKVHVAHKNFTSERAWDDKPEHIHPQTLGIILYNSFLEEKQCYCVIAR